MSKELEALYDIGEIEFEDIKSFYDDAGDITKVKYTNQFAIIERALALPTADEVCEHLNEKFGLKRIPTTLHFIYDKESKEFRMVSQNVVYRYISTKRMSDDAIELIDLDIDDIIILGKFYEGEIK